MSISQKYVCAQCGTTIPAKLNESSNSVEPSSKECPSCHCTNISIVIEEKVEDNRQILNG